MAQGIGILAFGVVVAVASDESISVSQLLSLIPRRIVVVCWARALASSSSPTCRVAAPPEQIFPFIILPQYFLAGRV